ncbi:MAG: C4-dicarboxylate ABC transporter substrate-binding protein [Lachnospiraceae bacterium]|jgi:TRAP-type C4-dicarboxylate transport system substrate-binding protein|nr:C4-dicarboxylate ABC transporter substrate-binding protein [Lachnospiraceae bacterium]
MRKLNKALAVIMAAAMTAATIAGCGGSNAGGTTEAPKTEAAADAKKEDTATTAAQAEAAPSDYHLELKLSHVFAPNEALTKNMQKIADNVRERTNGAIDIQCFPQSQLPVYQDGVAQVAQGANFISVEDPSYLADYVKDFNVLAGPMLVTSYDQYQYLLTTPEVQDMEAQLEKQGIKILNLGYIFGFRSMMTNKEIKTPDDLVGMKIRTPKSELYVNTINAMGATATPMGFADTISAVQQGVVDGLEGTIDAYGSNGSAEVAKKMALTKHLLGVCGAYINVDVYNSIPEEYRTILQEEFDKGAVEMVKEITENEAAQMEALEKEQGITFNEVDSAAFQEKIAPLYKDMEENKGVTPGLYDKFQEYIKNMK